MHQTCDTMMQRKLREGNIIGNMVSLDDIIEYVLGDESGEIPKFVRDCERKVKDELLGYTGKIRRSDAEKMTDGEEETFAEENAGELLDSISGANRTYMKMGMKLAAGMIFQLMGS